MSVVDRPFCWSISGPGVVEYVSLALYMTSRVYVLGRVLHFCDVC